MGYFGWPQWTLNVCGVLALCNICLMLAIWLRSPAPKLRHALSTPAAPAATKAAAASVHVVPPGFVSFQRKYLLVYFVVMLADWLQGTNMWTLYHSYDVDIGTLFSTGWISSAFFSTFIGTFVDKYGRRRGCIAYCVLEIVINCLEHVPTFEWLMVGRVLGGLSTCLLFSVFESWYDSAQALHFPQASEPEALIQQTASFATVGNWMMGVSAGVLAQVRDDGRP
jgi:hypothetical protein|eukprot:SAG25_NODE_1209_length_3601_cov_8.354940_4_plen_224_part_00